MGRSGDGMREAIPEDLDHDPEHRRQRQIAGWLLGITINALRGSRTVWSDKPNHQWLADEVERIALANGIVAFDEWHHAPACRANNWSRAMLPEGACTCGAAARKIR